MTKNETNAQHKGKMNSKTLIIAIGALLVIGAGTGLYTLTDSGETDCEEKYDQALNEEIDSGEIPDECEPVPEEVERQILIQALN